VVTNKKKCPNQKSSLLEFIWFGHFFFQSGALLGKTKSIPGDKTSTSLLEFIWFGNFFFQSETLLGKTKSIPSVKPQYPVARTILKDKASALTIKRV